MSNSSGISGVDLSSTLATECRNALACKSLHPSPEWLRAFLATQRPTTPVSALASTATFRILAGDITTILSPALTPVLPRDIHRADIKERKLPSNDIVVQILDIEDLGRSRWEQIEAIAAIERGEGTKGRQIIRVGVNEDGGQELVGPPDAAASAMSMTAEPKGPHKILVQDIEGTTAYGIEFRPIEALGLAMPMGGKLILKGCTIARGVILLEPTTIVSMGGKIEALHQQWISGKKERLSNAIHSQSPGN